MSDTLPGIGPGRWDAGRLAKSQEAYAYALIKALEEPHPRQSTYVFRLYTEDRENLSDLVSRYFQGATLTLGVGLWQGWLETVRVIEIVGTLDDLQSVVHLAGDIKERNNQSSVLVTYAPIARLDV